MTETSQKQDTALRQDLAQVLLCNKEMCLHSSHFITNNLDQQNELGFPCMKTARTAVLNSGFKEKQKHIDLIQ